MTMLDRMRRHRQWLKWSLGLVVLTFIFLYIPAFVQDPTVTDLATVLARVGDEEITVAEFRRVYLAQLQLYRTSSQGQITEQVLRQLGLDRQILQQMIDEHAALQEAERLRIRVSDAEVRSHILSRPDFQENGRFIGEQRYRQLLQLQNPPVTVAQFEEDVRRGLTLGRLRAAVTEWITVADPEIEEEYRRRNEKVKVDIVAVRADELRDEVTVADEDIAALYTQNPAAYEVPEKRRLRFLLIDQPAIFESITITPEQVERYYEDNVGVYSAPEQLRASHILLRTEGKDEAAVKTRAAEILAEARGGADFAELAKKYSEDETTGPNGGDLGTFGRGQMVPEFEGAAFSLDPGTISEPVRSAFGYHIIKVIEKTGGIQQPLEAVRESITNTLKQERADARATAMAQAIAAEVRAPADVDRAARQRGIEVQETGFAAMNEPIVGLGFTPEVSARAFQLAQGEVAGPIVTPQGPVFVTVTAIQAPYTPPLDEVKEQVREDVIRRKAMVLAQEKAAEAANTLKAATDFTAAAKAASLTVGTSELIARGAAFPEVGVSPAVEATAFSLAVGAVSAPVTTGSAAAIIHLVERQGAEPAALAESRESLRSDLLQQRQGQFFNAYMSKVKERLGISVDLNLLEQVLAV